MALEDLKEDYEDFNPAPENKVPAEWYNTVLASLKTNIAATGAKYSKPGGGIPEADLAGAVQTKLNALGGGGSGRVLGNHMQTHRGVYPAADLLVNAIGTTAPTYSSPVTYDWLANADRFRFGGKMVSNTMSSLTAGVNAAAGADPSNQYTWTSFEVEFWVPGPDVTLKFRNYSNSDYHILVDDMPVKSYWLNFPTNTLAYKYHQLRFADTESPHRIRILNGINGFVGAIIPNAQGEIFAAGPRFQCYMTGDSYVQGAASASEPGAVVAGAIPGKLAFETGWEVINGGQGTTGYIDDGGGSGGRSAFGSASRLAAMAEFDPNCVIVFGGGNDTSEDPDDVANNYAAPMWAAIKDQHPQAALVVVGIQPPNLFPFPSGAMELLNTKLRTKALASPDVDLWIDMRVPEFWVTDDSKDLFITTEFPASIHPGKAGVDNIVQRMLVQMRGASW